MVRPVFVFVLRHVSWLYWSMLYRPGWFRTLASTSSVLALKAYNIKPARSKTSFVFWGFSYDTSLFNTAFSNIKLDTVTSTSQSS